MLFTLEISTAPYDNGDVSIYDTDTSISMVNVGKDKGIHVDQFVQNNDIYFPECSFNLKHI